MKFKKPKFWDNKNLSFLAILLLPFSLIFYFFSFIKYFKKSKKFSIPVICIGNIYVGGTGKTPLAIEIYQITKSLGKKPGFIKKYYNYLEDEINMLKKIGPTFFNNEREEAINLLIQKECNLAILDDGFQDSTIKKDFSIICFNSNQWIGNGFIIPSGPLREKLSSIKKADCIFINGDKNIKIEEQIFQHISKSTRIFYSEYKILNVEKFQNKNLFAFAGIGNPSNFFNLLKKNNLNVVKSESFSDHHFYLEKEFNKILEMAKKLNAILITTEKDYNRMTDEQKKYCDFAKVDLSIENKNQFIDLLRDKI
tara:strand:- start:140 stop:1069 length:930 start_codon:yes stop_codon:yes gene_type:complete